MNPDTVRAAILLWAKAAGVQVKIFDRSQALPGNRMPWDMAAAFPYDNMAGSPLVPDFKELLAAYCSEQILSTSTKVYVFYFNLKR